MVAAQTDGRAAPGQGRKAEQGAAIWAGSGHGKVALGGLAAPDSATMPLRASSAAVSKLAVKALLQPDGACVQAGAALGG
jgi:hypothetical protein